MTPASGRGTWRAYYGIEDLACSLLCITQDQRGYLWFGTSGRGVLRHDGQVWTSFTMEDGLADDTVNCILEDRNGSLWMATGWHGGEGKGVSRFAKGRWRTFTTRDGLAHNSVTAMMEDTDGNLWLATAGGGVSRFDGSTWTTYSSREGLASDYVTAMLQVRDGTFWFGTGWFFMQEAGITRFDGHAWTDLVPAHGKHQQWRFLEDRRDSVWIAYDSGGIGRYDGENWSIYGADDGVADEQVYDLMQDKEGIIWAATRNGVSCFDGSSWERIDGVEGLSKEGVNAIYQSQDGHVWAATTSGLCRYDGYFFRTFNTDDGLVSDRVTFLQPDSKGGLWIGTVEDGVSYHRDGAFSSFTKADGLAENRVWSIVEDRTGRVWFATIDGGVSCYDGDNWATYTTADGLVDDSVVSICEDGDGNLWFGSNGDGLSRFDGVNWTTFTEADGLANNRVKWIEEDRSGALWFGTSGGVCRYDGAEWVTFDTSNGLADNFVQSVLVDRRGDVWVATGMGGVSRYNGSRWVTYSQEDGLPSNWMTWIFEDDGGHLWFGTMNGGVCRFDGETFMVINRQDGLADNTVWAVTQDKEGIYWFATFHGITRYQPQEPEPPPVYIDAVITDRRQERFDGQAIRSVVNHAIFEYRGMSFNTRPDGLLYRHQLIGYDPDWVYSRRRRVIYANLPVGSYMFEVEALDRDLVSSASPARLPLVVERDVRNEQIDELEQRVRERTEMLEKSNRQLATSNTELEQFAYVASHDLQEPLRVMTSFLELLGRRLKGDLDESSQHYIERSVAAATRMRQLIEDLLALSRVTTKAREFEATDCARLVGVVRDNLGIAIEESGGKITGAGDLPTILADAGQLSQLFQNLIGNAIKFRGECAPEIDVEARRVEGEWLFSVRDNGIGIDPQYGERIFRIFQRLHTREEYSGTGIGLAISKKIVERHGGNIWFERNATEGTTFFFTIADQQEQAAEGDESC